MRSVDWYETELSEVDRQREALRSFDKTLSVLRAGLFFGGILLLGLSFAAAQDSPLGASILWWTGWLVLIAFFVAVTIHENMQARIEVLRNRRSVLRRLVARIERRWDRLPIWSPSEKASAMQRAVDSGSVADDLDLFGSGSLMQLVSVAYTGPGLRALGDWLNQPAYASSAKARAAAARSLVSNRESRVRFYELARRAAGSAAEPDAFSAWASGPGWLGSRRWLVAWAWISPVLALTLFVGGLLFWPIEPTPDGDLAAVSSLNFAGGIVLASIPLGINLLLTIWMSGPVHGIFARAVNRKGDIEGYAEMFACGEALPSQPELIGKIRGQLISDKCSATEGMKRLQRIAILVAGRRGGVSYIVFMILQLICLWDVHLLRKLESWQAQYGRYAGDWFHALGQLEALQSLAALYDDYPDWVEPVWQDCGTEAVLCGVGLAHPLLKDGVRVTNNVRIGPQGSLLLVTGSNMSGKSTMLRSIGLNVVLAGAGAPVCAESLSLPSIELATSIRVRDSVREGVSFYMAELHRLRDVVNQARKLGPSGDRMVLYLLDEILQGTNSRERSVAVVRVLRHLLDSGAIGAISTHDLELAEDPELEAVAQVVHFRETIEVDDAGNEVMKFDYRMREGVTPTTNALRLLEMVGLGEGK